jgi:hypothetical protein
MGRPRPLRGSLNEHEPDALATPAAPGAGVEIDIDVLRQFTMKETG